MVDSMDGGAERALRCRVLSSARLMRLFWPRAPGDRERASSRFRRRLIENAAADVECVPRRQINKLIC